MKKLFAISICLAILTIGNAQTIDKKWNIGLHGGLTQYNGDLGNDLYKTQKGTYAMGGISVSRYFAGHFDLNLLATKGSVGTDNTEGNFKRNVTTAILNCRFNILGPKSFARPYVFVGGGVILYDKDLDIEESKVDYIAPSFGGGLNIKLGTSVMLNFQETFMYTS